MYSLDPNPSIDKKLKKVEQILMDPHRFKPLKHDLNGLRRVHIDKSFVLVYEIKGNTVILLDFDHHDSIYLA